MDAHLTCGECGIVFEGDEALANGAMHGHWIEAHGYTDDERGQLEWEIDATVYSMTKAVIRRPMRKAEVAHG